MPDKTIKDREGKPPMHLILWKSVYWFIKVRLYGMKKYSEDSWKQVSPVDFWDAAMRHLTQFGEGNRIDAESGLPHIAHALCNIWYLTELTTNEPTFEEEK